MGELSPCVVQFLLAAQHRPRSYGALALCSCRVLSVETGNKGARQFIATTYQEFWARYRRLESGRHYYEIVREGWPCHLYFGERQAHTPPSA